MLKVTSRHACSFVQAGDDPSAAMLRWLADGVQAGERVVLIFEPAAGSIWLDALARSGVDVQEAMAEGKLVRTWAWDQDSALEFSSLRMARQAWAMIEDALASCSGLRVLADMSWTRTFDLPADKLCHWEATLDCLLSEDLPVQVICQYNVDSVTTPALLAAVRTHARSIHAGHEVFNPFHEATQILEQEPALNACSNDPALVGHLMQRLHPELQAAARDPAARLSPEAC